LDWGGMCEDLRECMCEDVWVKCEESERVWIVVDVWGKFMGVCEWYDAYDEILIFFKGVNCYFTD